MIWELTAAYKIKIACNPPVTSNYIKSICSQTIYSFFFTNRVRFCITKKYWPVTILYPASFWIHLGRTQDCYRSILFHKTGILVCCEKYGFRTDARTMDNSCSSELQQTCFTSTIHVSSHSTELGVQNIFTHKAIRSEHLKYRLFWHFI